MKKIVLTLMGILIGTLTYAQTVLTYSDHEPYGNMRTRFINDVFFKTVEKESRGTIKIETHWGGEIAKAQGELKAIADKKTDLIVAVPEYSEKQLPLHQLFKSFAIGPSGKQQVLAIQKIYQELPELTAEYHKNGVKPVLIATGYPVAFFSKNPLDNLKNIQGQTWRSASFWHRDFLKNAGATPVTSRWGQETYDKLANGEMHGLMVNIDSAIDIKAYEHTPYALVSDKFWLGHIYPVVISLESWQKLDTKQQKAFHRAAKKSYRKLGDIMQQHYQEILVKSQSLGVSVRELSDDEVKEWGKLSDYNQVQRDWANKQKQLGNTTVDKVLRVMKKYLNKK